MAMSNLARGFPRPSKATGEVIKQQLNLLISSSVYKPNCTSDTSERITVPCICCLSPSPLLLEWMKGWPTSTLSPLIGGRSTHREGRCVLDRLTTGWTVYSPGWTACTGYTHHDGRYTHRDGRRVLKEDQTEIYCPMGCDPWQSYSNPKTQSGCLSAISHMNWLCTGVLLVFYYISCLIR